jgi:hypothetical protein
MAAKSHAQASVEARCDVAAPQLSRHLFQVEEAERRRLARELHDETSQGLALVRFHLGELREEGGSKTKKAVGEAFQVLDRTIEGLRRIVGRLSPQSLEQMGLAGSIRQEARGLEADHGIHAKVRISETLGELSPEAELALYRQVQEALHNRCETCQRQERRHRSQPQGRQSAAGGPRRWHRPSQEGRASAPIVRDSGHARTSALPERNVSYNGRGRGEAQGLKSICIQLALRILDLSRPSFGW